MNIKFLYKNQFKNNIQLELIILSSPYVNKIKILVDNDDINMKINKRNIHRILGLKENVKFIKNNDQFIEEIKSNIK